MHNIPLMTVMPGVVFIIIRLNILMSVTNIVYNGSLLICIVPGVIIFKLLTTMFEPNMVCIAALLTGTGTNLINILADGKPPAYLFSAGNIKKRHGSGQILQEQIFPAETCYLFFHFLLSTFVLLLQNSNKKLSAYFNRLWQKIY